MNKRTENYIRIDCFPICAGSTRDPGGRWGKREYKELMREITYLNLYIDIDKCYIIHWTYIYVTQIDMTKMTCIQWQFFKPAANFNSKQRAAPEPVVKNGSASIVTCQIFGALIIKCNNSRIQYPWEVRKYDLALAGRDKSSEVRLYNCLVLFKSRYVCCMLVAMLDND